MPIFVLPFPPAHSSTLHFALSMMTFTGADPMSDQLDGEHEDREVLLPPLRPLYPPPGRDVLVK